MSERKCVAVVDGRTAAEVDDNGEEEEAGGERGNGEPMGDELPEGVYGCRALYEGRVFWQVSIFWKYSGPSRGVRAQAGHHFTKMNVPLMFSVNSSYF